MNKIIFFLFVFFMLLSSCVLADVKLPAIISSNMVLQQNSNAALWGWADVGEDVSITNTWNNQTVRTVADQNGEWKLILKTIKAGGPYSITIKGKNSVELANVMLGEVWLCSGQSNMEFPLEKQDGWKTGSVNAEQEIAQANYPNIRLFTVQKTTSGVPLKDVKGTWSECSPSTARRFSAVAYYFGKELWKETGIPIGLIHSSWGGTPAEAWTKKEILEADTDYKPIFDRLKKSEEDYPKSITVYEQQMEQWKKDSAIAKQKGDTVAKAPSKPAAVRYYQAPTYLYNAMIAPLIPYTLKGVIWYQGESNAGRAYQYRKLFPAMIANWRKDWNSDFPFYFVQIAPHQGQGPEIREAQLLTMLSVPKTGMAVITDAGDSLDIHPTNKEIVGKRLALWALAKDYGKANIEYSGPVYKSMKRENEKIRITFDHAVSGLEAKHGQLNEFIIAGEDQKFLPAQAKIEGNTIVVWNEMITKPVAVRYSWKNFPHPDLYNKSGLPATPFRTDQWPGVTFGKN